MIHSEKGKITLEVPKDDLIAEAIIYGDLAGIFDAIREHYGLDVLLTYLEIYTTKEINIDGSRN